MNRRLLVFAAAPALAIVGGVSFVVWDRAERQPVAAAPPAGPSTAVRVKLPGAGTTTTVDTPISIRPVCQSAPSSNHGFLWPLLTPLRMVLFPAPAFAQYTKGLGTGDVHVVTLHGLRYDFQAVGEFIAVKTEQFQVQSRLRPYGTSRTASVTTALAIDSGGDLIAVYAGDDNPLRIDHAPATLGNELRTLPHGMTVQRLGNGIVVGRANQFEVRVMYGSYLDYIISFCGPHEGTIEGLLGGADGKPEESLVARNGSSIRFGNSNARGIVPAAVPRFRGQLANRPGRVAVRLRAGPVIADIR
jgi:hypothetical protein